MRSQRLTDHVGRVSEQHFDVVVVGAGLSGICAGYHLQTQCPGKALRHSGRTQRNRRHVGFVPLSRHSVRFGHVHDGLFLQGLEGNEGGRRRSAILNYLRETAQEFGIDRQIRYQHRVKSASWSSEDSLWTVEAEVGSANEPVRPRPLHVWLPISVQRLLRLRQRLLARIRRQRRFQGPVVHPQHWPEDLDYRGQAGGRDRQRCDRGDAGSRDG